MVVCGISQEAGKLLGVFGPHQHAEVREDSCSPGRLLAIAHEPVPLLQLPGCGCDSAYPHVEGVGRHACSSRLSCRQAELLDLLMPWSGAAGSRILPHLAVSARSAGRERSLVTGQASAIHRDGKLPRPATMSKEKIGKQASLSGYRTQCRTCRPDCQPQGCCAIVALQTPPMIARMYLQSLALLSKLQMQLPKSRSSEQAILYLHLGGWWCTYLLWCATALHCGSAKQELLHARKAFCVKAAIGCDLVASRVELGQYPAAPGPQTGVLDCRRALSAMQSLCLPQGS